MTTQIGRSGAGDVAGAVLSQPLLGLTFDDVLLIPQYSEILPGDASVASRFSRHITLNTPVVSAAMDTVTEDGMAIAIALEGGIGVIHRNLSIGRQAEEVDRVKRSESGMITDPVTLHPQQTVQTALDLIDEAMAILEDRRLRLLVAGDDDGMP